MDAARLTAVGFLALVLGLLAGPAVAQPSAGKFAKIVVLSVGVNPPSAPFNVAFEQRLRDLGWVEGRTMTLQWRVAKPGERLADVAAATVRDGVDVIVTPGPEAPLQAAREATAQDTRTPIVMIAINYDPVERGYVASLPRPGGNVTGVFYRQFEVGVKQLELLTQALPGVSRVGLLWEQASADQVKPIEVAARALRVEVVPVEVKPPWDYEGAIATLKRGRVGGVVVAGSPVFFRDRARLQALLIQHRLPASGTLAYADAGSLISYGPDLLDFFRRGADYVDRILRGARPADLPVEQPTRFELSINAKTAKTLGITVPPEVLARADTVIQ